MEDSITFGVGVEMRQTFPKILENKLKEVLKFPSQVFKLGANTYTTFKEYSYMKELYDNLKPKMVMIEFFNGNNIRRYF